MADFVNTYGDLNKAQRQAVDNIEGPLLVVAGPGTGKTQLLSVRAANILRQTDAKPENILCLTFTEKAATNMRERMLEIIGPEARKIVVKTFHGLGTEIINSYPHYFFNAARLEAAPEAVSLELVDELLSSLPLDNPLALKFVGQNTLVRDVQKGIARAKEAGLTPAKLRAITEANLAYIESMSDEFMGLVSQRLSKKQLDDYQSIIDDLPEEEFSIDPIATYSNVLKRSLQTALDYAQESGKTTALSEWKREWLETRDGQKVFKDVRRNQWWLALSGVYESYQTEMHERGYFDFADMILEVSEQLQKNETLRADIQERFHYIMLDEFQDTNDAQFRLSYLITNNPAHEGRPNIMAVGDDDQAIYRFQGAELSNIQRFIDSFRDTKLIVLRENYRSHQSVLNVGGDIASKIEHRLVTQHEDIEKDIVSKAKITTGNIEHLSYPSQPHQFTGVAQQVKTLFEHTNGTIAILARGHDSLQRMAHILQEYEVPVRYERRSNVLEHSAVVLVANILRLLDSIHRGDVEQASALISEIIAADAFELEPKTLWQFAASNRFRDDWLSALTESSDDSLCRIGNWLLELSTLARQQPLAVVIEHVLGLRSLGDFTSPLKSYYFEAESVKSDYIQTLSALQRLRSLAAEFTRQEEPTLSGFVTFLELNREHGVVIADESAFLTGESAVQLMTVHKAKGLEFDAVFIVDAVEKQWQPRRSSRVPRVNNLEMLQEYGEDEDDYARLLFVAATRAKSNLTFTSFRQDMAGKGVLHTPLIHEVPPQEIDDGIQLDDSKVAELNLVWPELQHSEQEHVLRPLLEGYQLSVTHLLTFLDLERGGPLAFVERNLLRLPSVKSPSLAFGSALHKALQKAQLQVNAGDFSFVDIESEYCEQLHRQQLITEEEERYREHGVQLLKDLLEKDKLELPKGSLPERSLKQVRVGGAIIRGELDRIDYLPDELRIVDYKTGTPLKSPITTTTKTNGLKAFKHRTQLTFYALLARESGLANHAQNVSGQMIYLEAQNDKDFSAIYTPTEDDLQQLRRLINVVWGHIQSLDWPDTGKYTQDFEGSMQFIEDLLTRSS